MFSNLKKLSNSKKNQNKFKYNNDYEIPVELQITNDGRNFFI